MLLDGLIISWLGLTVSALLAVWAAVFVAATVRGLTGFGLAIVLVPLLGLVVPPERAVLMSILLAIMMGPLGYRAARRSLERSVICPIVLAAMATAPIGLFLLVITPPTIASITIAGVAVLSFGLLVSPRSAKPPPGRMPMVLTGMASGLLGGFGGMPGPPVILYFVRSGIPRHTARDAMIVIFFWSPVTVAVAALIANRFDLTMLFTALSGAPALLAGNAVGTVLFGRAPDRIWRALTLLIIAAAAFGSLGRLTAG